MTPPPSPSVASRKPAVRAFVPLLWIAMTAPVYAHHSFAMYDPNKTVTLKGTVQSFQWTNPHIVLWLNAEQAGAPPQLWTLEISSPGAMTRAGWTRHSLQPGDKVVVEIAPLRDGDHGGSLKRVTTANGTVLTNELRTICRPGLQ